MPPHDGDGAADVAARLAHLEAEAARYRELLDGAPDAIVVVDLGARILLVNAQTEALLGYTRDEVLGQPLDLLIPDRFHGVHGSHLARYFARPSARPMGSRLELFARRKDGSEIPIEVSLSPHGAADATTVSAAIRDISERKQLEREVRVNAARLESAVESSEDALALFDADDRLVLCNSAFRVLLHAVSPGQLVGMRYQDLLGAWLDDIALPEGITAERYLAERLARRRREPTSSVDVELKDGRRLRVMDRHTGEGGIVKTVWDLTGEHRRAEELRLARAEAEAASEAKTEFLSSMSHELRTPLNAILGFAQLLERDRREPLSTRHKERVEQILRGGEHLLRLIDDVLDLARIETGRVSVSLEPVNVIDALEEVRRTLEPVAERHDVHLVVAPYADRRLDVVFADRTRFVQILMNYGSNAVKYNRPGGGVTFAVGSERPGFVRVTVSDTGLGVPLDKQRLLFQPFQRAGQETGPIEGTGIGLVITKRLAERMDGAVGFTSAPGVGSSFWVDVPAHLEARAPRISPTRAPAGALHAGVPRLVLYVEDNPANVRFLRDLLADFDGVELVTVPTAELGVEVARARHPSVVLMDINLPGMSGVDALKVLKSDPDPATRAIPVVALTAAASERDRQRGQLAGFARYLTKPVKVDELVTTLEELFTTP